MSTTTAGKAKTLRELTAERTELIDEMNALIAMSEEGELDEEQMTRFEDLARTDEDESGNPGPNPGLIQAKTIEMDKRERFDQARKMAAMTRAQNSPSIERHEASLKASAKRKRIRRPRIARLKAFAGDTADDDAFYTGMWLRAIKSRMVNEVDERAEAMCTERGFQIMAVQTGGTDTAGGFLVPDPLAATIIDNRERIGITRRLVDIVPMTSDTLAVPKQNASLTVQYPGEATAITPSDQSFTQVNLTAVKRAILNAISAELSDDALINMTDRAAQEMARALALQEDEEFINGDGTGTYGTETGLLTAIGAAAVHTAPTGIDTWAEITDTEIVNWLGLLPSAHDMDGEMAILCSREFYWQVLVRLMLAAGGNTIQTIQQGPGNASYLGIPVFFTGRMPTATAVNTVCALYGNFSNACMLGDRTGVRIRMSIDYQFNLDVMNLRATTRYDLNVHDAGDGSNVGAYTALKTAAT